MQVDCKQTLPGWQRLPIVGKGCVKSHTFRTLNLTRAQSQGTMVFPTMEAPQSIGDSPISERIRQIYADLPSIFAKDIARRQQLGIMGPSPATPTNDAPTPTAFNNPTTSSNPDTPVPGSIFAQGSHPLKCERPQDTFSADALTNIRRDTGKGTASASPSMMPPPSSIPITSSTSGSNGSQISSPSPTSGMNSTMHAPSQGPQQPQQPSQSGHRSQQSQSQPQQQQQQS